MMSRDGIERANQVDLLALIGRDTRVRKVANTNGGEYAGPCPFCGGKDRLRIQPQRGRWWCRQCGGRHWHDAIDYVRQRDRADFEEACRRLRADENQVVRKKKMKSQSINDLIDNTNPLSQSNRRQNTAPPSEKWQQRAREWLAECEQALWSDRGTRALAWLHQERGLNDTTLRVWHIGYNAADQWDTPGQWGFDSGKRIYLPRGITIPCQVAGTLWYVKIRRPQGDPKYTSPRGSVPALFGAETLGQHNYAVLTEGEFDAILAWQCLQHSTNPEWHTVGVATLGSATNSLDIDAWAPYMLPVSRFLVCYDADQAGEQGSERWNSLSNRVRRVMLPTSRPGIKDLTDFHKSGGSLLDLITFEIARDRWLHEQRVPSGKAAQVAQVAQAAQMGLSGHASPEVDVAPSEKVAQAAQVAQPMVQEIPDELAQLHQQRDALLEEWNRLLDEMEPLDQESAEFNQLFSNWQKLDQEYQNICQQIAALEFETWHADQTSSLNDEVAPWNKSTSA